MKLTASQLDQLHDCIGRFQENCLSAEQKDWLNTILGDSEEARELYLEYMQLSANMQWNYGMIPGDVGYPDEKIILGSPANPELLKATSSKYSKKEMAEKPSELESSPQLVTKMWVAVLVLMVGVFAGGFYLLQSQSSKEKQVAENDLLQIGVSRKLTEGTLAFSFPTGSQVALTAPATFTVTGENSIRLMEGKLVANVPASGIGFRVDTPRGRIVDLGTTFSVHATTDLNTEVQVFRGRVIASLVDYQGVVQSSKKVEANQAMKINFMKEEVVESVYSSNDFAANLKQEYGITKHSKAVVFQEKMPESVANGQYQVFEHNDSVFIFPEKQNVRLEREIKLNIGKPGVYQNYADLKIGKSSIPLGTTVDCFRALFDPVGKPAEHSVVEGEIHFDRPILGVIIHGGALTKSDSLFRLDSQEDVGQAIAHQAVEILTSAENNDRITISEDRRTLSFQMFAVMNLADEFRVILQSRSDSL